MDISLYLNAEASDPAYARVTSLVDRARLPLPRLTAGATLALTIYLVTAAGGYHASSGDADLEPRLALGVPGGAALVELEDADFTVIDDGWTCTLPLTAAALSLFLAGQSGAPLVLEFSTLDGTARTVWAALPAEFNRAVA